ncbi:hypothetical protein N9L68_00825 [bacterium]|nr:hypothetical protein [bacterium]MDA8582730.1 hypothetical protein [bacterium]
MSTDTGVQTESTDGRSRSEEEEQTVIPPGGKRRPALIYAAVPGTKGESSKSVQRLLAQVNNYHANMPTEIVFRLHSDQGGEFNSDELKEYCARHGIHKSTTAGYDPNANASAESSVGILKRRTRYLFSGCRLPTTWWAVATLAAAQLCRADAGLEEYPNKPFGTRAMIVKDPKPKNAFVPRAEPATVFGPSSSIPTGYWTYQRGWVKCRTNLQPQGLSQEELTWVKINMSNWDTPDTPTPLPEPALYDSGSIVPLRAAYGAITRDAATCPACVAVRRKQKIRSRHTQVWGECLRASPPPPEAEQPLPAVIAEESLPGNEPAEDIQEEDIIGKGGC